MKVHIFQGDLAVSVRKEPLPRGKGTEYKHLTDRFTVTCLEPSKNKMNLDIFELLNTVSAAGLRSMCSCVIVPLPLGLHISDVGLCFFSNV